MLRSVLNEVGIALLASRRSGFHRSKLTCFADSESGPSSADQVEDKDDQRNHQQQVNQPAA
jgi:hypothetical protein